MDQRSDALVELCGKTIFRAFERYNDNFRRITERAVGNFERRDWRNSRKDLAERIELYDKSVQRVVIQLETDLSGELIRDRDFWARVREFYGDRLENYPDGIFAMTFYNSVTRRIFETIGFDPELEFVTRDIEDSRERAYWLHTRTFINWGNLKELMEQVLELFRFNVRYRGQRRIAAQLESDITADLGASGVTDPEVLRVEFIQTRFFQSDRAYVVGKLFGADWERPLVIAFRNTDDGIVLDATITSVDEVSMIFGFTRSYIFVDLEPVESVVSFLTTLLPNKPVDELYTVLGRLRQGKTERYRLFSRHLRTAPDRFVHAAGDPGLVMLVFTLPSYDLVFKIIRDEFGYPKNVNRRQVMAKYNLVFKHDRAGRLIDTQEFRHLTFPVSAFDDDLLDDLMRSTSQTVKVVNNEVVIDHLYIERRLRPLNLYLNEVDRDAAVAAVIDYGQAIKDLALTNIFPGDLLLKNFGVTRHGRVVFYDYDELCLVTECTFRELPEGDEDDEMRAGEWFYVGEDDVFPEQFIRFLAMDAGLKKAFMEAHGDLMTASFWRGIKAMHANDEAPFVVPYRS